MTMFVTGRSIALRKEMGKICEFSITGDCDGAGRGY